MSATLRALHGTGAVLRIGATPVPHAEILDFVRPRLATRGIDVQIVIYDSFDEPNQHVAQGQLDANYFQYRPFLDEFNQRTGHRLTPVAAVHIEPFTALSASLTGVDDIGVGGQVALPADPVNAGRSLTMLADMGLITLEAKGPHPSVDDVTANPRQLLFKHIDSVRLLEVINDFDVIFLFGNHALAHGIDLARALHTDHGDPHYAEYLVSRLDNRDDVALRELGRVLRSRETRDFIQKRYAGTIIPAP